MEEDRHLPTVCSHDDHCSRSIDSLAATVSQLRAWRIVKKGRVMSIACCALEARMLPQPALDLESSSEKSASHPPHDPLHRATARMTYGQLRSAFLRADLPPALQEEQRIRSHGSSHSCILQRSSILVPDV